MNLYQPVQISAIFVVLSLGMEMMLDSLKGVKDKSILMLPITLVAMATAVMLSSYILQETQDIPFMTNLIAAITVAAVTIVMGIALWVLSKLDSGNIVKGAFSVVIIAGTVAAASQLLSMGDYSNFPTVDWGLGVGMAMLAFVPAMLITGNFLPMIAMGAIGALLVAGTILASSYILGAGDYSGGPTTEWATGVGLAFLAFGSCYVDHGKSALLDHGRNRSCIPCNSGRNDSRCCKHAQWCRFFRWTFCRMGIRCRFIVGYVYRSVEFCQSWSTRLFNEHFSRRQNRKS